MIRLRQGFVGLARLRRGFTLLELVMALSLSAVMGAGMVVAFNGGRRAEARTTADADARQTGRIALEWIVRDLSSCWTTESELSHISGTSDELGGLASDRVVFATTGHLPAWRELTQDAHNAELQGLTTSVVTAGVPAPETDYIHVEYNIGLGNGEGFGGLVRRVKKIAFTGSEEAEDGWVDQPLAREVVALEILYYDGSEWVEEWDSAEREPAEAYPTAFRVTLKVRVGPSEAPRVDPLTGERVLRTFSRTVAIPTKPFIEPKEPEEEEAAGAAGGGGR